MSRSERESFAFFSKELLNSGIKVDVVLIYIDGRRDPDNKEVFENLLSIFNVVVLRDLPTMMKIMEECNDTTELVPLNNPKGLKNQRKKIQNLLHGILPGEREGMSFFGTRVTSSYRGP